jgi:hypothetical protein
MEIELAMILCLMENQGNDNTATVSTRHQLQTL